MSEPENFIARWSRRKRESAEEEAAAAEKERIRNLNFEHNKTQVPEVVRNLLQIHIFK